MSYTRRTGNFGNKPPNSPLSSVGQRRQGANTFGNTGGGQLMNKSYPQPGFQNKPQQQQNQPQQHYQTQAQQQEKPKIVPQQGTQNQQLNQQPKPQAQKSMQPPMTPNQQPANMQQAAEQLVSDQNVMSENKPVSTNSVEIPGLGNGAGATPTTDGENISPPKNKPFWMKRNGRVNKAERAKRRNVRLRKLLQPKNALMIINELVGHVTFELSESKSGFEDVYKASVLVEGTEHAGQGKSKALAKTAAAEAAVRSMILNKLKITPTTGPTADEEIKDVKMEVVNEENQEEDVSWTHIASFAIHKLFSSWGDDGNMADMMTRTSSVSSLHEGESIKDGSIRGLQTQPEQKPAKKLPANAVSMNPIMLLNQMHPSAKYEELGKSGSPPHIQFTIKCIVGDQSFVGAGQNKKAARKQAAFQACKALLEIQYPPDILEGTAADKAAPMETS